MIERLTCLSIASASKGLSSTKISQNSSSVCSFNSIALGLCSHSIQGLLEAFSILCFLRFRVFKTLGHGGLTSFPITSPGASKFDTTHINMRRRKHRVDSGRQSESVSVRYGAMTHGTVNDFACHSLHVPRFHVQRKALRVYLLPRTNPAFLLPSSSLCRARSTRELTPPSRNTPLGYAPHRRRCYTLTRLHC